MRTGVLAPLTASFARFVDDGRICMTNNAAERRVRTVAIGRRNWTFCGSDRGGERAAAVYTLIQTYRLNDVDPHAWLAYVIATISDHRNRCLDPTWDVERLQCTVKVLAKAHWSWMKEMIWGIIRQVSARA